MAKKPEYYQPISSNRLLRWPEVQERVGICRSHAHKLASLNPPQFPRPVKLGTRASAWIESEITDWVNNRISISRGGYNNERTN